MRVGAGALPPSLGRPGSPHAASAGLGCGEGDERERVCAGVSVRDSDAVLFKKKASARERGRER